MSCSSHLTSPLFSFLSSCAFFCMVGHPPFSSLSDFLNPSLRPVVACVLPFRVSTALCAIFQARLPRPCRSQILPPLSHLAALYSLVITLHAFWSCFCFSNVSKLILSSGSFLCLECSSSEPYLNSCSFLKLYLKRPILLEAFPSLMNIPLPPFQTSSYPHSNPLIFPLGLCPSPSPGST